MNFLKENFRFLVRSFVFVLIVGLALAHMSFGIEKVAPIDAYCPFGAVESFFTLAFKGEFLQRIFTSAFILLVIFLLATVFLGRVFCGFFCPLGTLQEWMRALGAKLGIKNNLEFPEKVDKYLRYVKYLILFLIVYFSFYLNDLIFRNYDPYNALMHLGEEFEEKPVGYAILFLIVIISLFSKNFWCRYFCPLGAFLGVFKKIGFFKIKRNSKTCVSCGVCDFNCPAGLKIQSVKEVKDADCISCGRCVKNCPESSLSFKILGKKVSKNRFHLLIVLVVILPLLILPFTPIWKTKPESNIINSLGEVNPQDIRGSNTLEYLIEKTNVPFAEFQSKLNLPSEIDKKVKLKEIGTKYNLKNSKGDPLEAEDFRVVVEEYLKKKTENQSRDSNEKPKCPFGETQCEFPGDCVNYSDQNKNGVCDLSE